FKQALREGLPQIGLWVGFADACVAEALATTGFDWLLIDGEHAPNDLRTTLAQLQAVAPCPAHPIVRPPNGDAALIKQILDLGAQTLLLPMVETAAQAERLVAAMRYPPAGVRGVGSALARSSRWNQVDGYLHAADAQMCLLVQAESLAALDALPRIAAVDGVDGVFFGPADLSASMGLLGQPGHERVQSAIVDGIARVRAAGKAAGVLATDPVLARRYLEAGALFVAVGVDTTLLVRAATQLAAAFKSAPAATPDRADRSAY
ncbi:MAG TPA: 4-hydroxy-2-oxoheptanedioate aldolase, partial [Ideonella sp.]|nr:4-hydroxy-2-oxoheptanedioate aldolase [Ideonella sp.]